MWVPEYWRFQRQRYGNGEGGLEGEECPHCRKKIFPPRDICPNPECGRGTLNNNLDMIVRTSTKEKSESRAGVEPA